MRYLVPGDVSDFPKCVPERLRAFGPWSANGSASGVILTAVDFPCADYVDHGRETDDGLTYWPTATKPTIGQLFRSKIIAEECNQVELTNGERIVIRPAYLEPRKIFSNGTIGDPLTQHGQRTRRVIDLLTGKNSPGILHPEALALWLEAVGIVYRATPELIDDLSLFSIGDVDSVLAAVFTGPKQPPGVDTSPSSSPGSLEMQS